MKSLWVAVLSTSLILGVGGSVMAQQQQQQPGTSSSGQSEATKPAEDKATTSSSTSSSSSGMPDAGKSAPSGVTSTDRSSSTSTSVDVKTDRRSDSGSSDVGSASPRTSGESRRIFGLEPTAAILIGAAILLVVILALVAMARGGSDTVSHTDIDLDRRR
jgi:uncharacterized protein HemX